VMIPFATVNRRQLAMSVESSVLPEGSVT